MVGLLDHHDPIEVGMLSSREQALLRAVIDRIVPADD